MTKQRIVRMATNLWRECPYTAVVLVLTILLTACPSQQTYSQMWVQAGKLADTYITIYAPTWPEKANFDTAWASAATAIANFKPGTPCSNVIAAINDAAGILATVPVLDQQQLALMAAIVATVDVVTGFFQQCQPAGVAGAARAVRVTPVQTAADKLTPPKSVDDVNKLWADAGGKPVK